MNILFHDCLKVMALYLAIMITGCVSSQSAGSEKRQEEPEIVDSGYQITGARNTNQSNIKVQPNRERPSNLSLEMMLQQLPGVRIRSGRGAYAQFVVDGTSSSFMADTSPLFVVNGMAMGTDFSVVYSMVNPNDVSSLSVLKGSDASIYGTRGANGVILIRTEINK